MDIQELKERIDTRRRQIDELTSALNQDIYTLQNTQQAINPDDIQTCASRMDQAGPWERKENLDRWERIGNDRCCSFCGSMHPDDLNVALDLDTTKIDVSDKRYKVYVRRPGILNAGAGAIKFYNWHLPADIDVANALLTKINTRAYQTRNDFFSRIQTND